MTTVKLHIQTWAIASCLLLSAFSGSGEMTWKGQGIYFDVPTGFSIETNKPNEYTAGNGHVYLLLMPWEEEVIKERSLPREAKKLADLMGYTGLTVSHKMENQSVCGNLIEGNKDGVHALIGLMYIRSQKRNFVSVVTYQPGYEAEAMDLAYSFRWGSN